MLLLLTSLEFEFKTQIHVCVGVQGSHTRHDQTSSSAGEDYRHTSVSEAEEYQANGSA